MKKRGVTPDCLFRDSLTLKEFQIRPDKICSQYGREKLHSEDDFSTVYA